MVRVIARDLELSLTLRLKTVRDGNLIRIVYEVFDDIGNYVLAFDPSYDVVEKDYTAIGRELRERWHRE